MVSVRRSLNHLTSRPISTLVCTLHNGVWRRLFRISKLMHISFYVSLESRRCKPTLVIFRRYTQMRGVLTVYYSYTDDTLQIGARTP
jgi:hypothetical protein